MKSIRFYGIARVYKIFKTKLNEFGLLVGSCGGAGHYKTIEDAFLGAKCIEDQDIKDIRQGRGFCWPLNCWTVGRR